MGSRNYGAGFSLDRTLEDVKGWARKRGLQFAEPAKQMLKLTEEVGELAAAIAREDKKEAKDAVGDVMVVLTVLCEQMSMDMRQCFWLAHETIKGRTGVMKNGVFVKQEDLESNVKKPEALDG